MANAVWISRTTLTVTRYVLADQGGDGPPALPPAAPPLALPAPVIKPTAEEARRKAPATWIGAGLLLLSLALRVAQARRARSVARLAVETAPALSAAGRPAALPASAPAVDRAA